MFKFCLIKFVVPIFLLIVFYLPLNAYSQNLEEISETTFSGNMTGVVKRDLPLDPSKFWYYLFGSFIIILVITVTVAILIKLNLY